MKSVAFLTMDSMEGFFAYDHLTVQPLAQRNISVQDVSWRQHDVQWNTFDLVVIRSPWDYQQAPEQFLNVLETISTSGTVLENSLSIVRWNIHKSYLKFLQDHGIPIVPTHWWPRLNADGIQRLMLDPDCQQWVVKPLVGANSDDTFRVHPGAAPHTIEQAIAAFGNRELMVQPFVQSVIDHGEYSLFYFGGHYSHCILKTPQKGDFRVQEEHGGVLKTVEVPADLKEVAERTLEVIPGKTLYARVDLVRLSRGEPAIMEVELIEPSMYLAHHPQAPERFADAIAECLNRVSI